MPPKKIKLITKETKEIKVDSKDIDITSKNVLINDSEKEIDKKLKVKKTLIKKKPLDKPLENIIPEDKIIKINDIEVEPDIEKNTDIEKEEVIDFKEDVIEEETEKIDIDAEESEVVKKNEKEVDKNKTTHKSKHKQSNILKQTETSFDMFGSNNIDYRNTIINYDCSKNKTLPKMTKYEIALVIGKRAKQIEDGANANIKVMAGKNSIEIAEEELRQGVIPFYIKRPIGNSFELFKLADMEFFLD